MENLKDLTKEQLIGVIEKLKEEALKPQSTIENHPDILNKYNTKIFQQLSENIPIVLYSALYDESSTTLFVSNQVKVLLGYEPEAFYKSSDLWGKIVHPDDLEHVWEAVKEHRKNRTDLKIDYRVITKNGEIKWVHDRAIPILNEENTIERIEGFMEDVSERKRIEMDLNKSEHFLTSLTNALTDSIFTINVRSKEN